jgi:hypothetical protein
MTTCSVVGCDEKVVGGFREIIPAGHLQDATASIPGPRTCWCRTHETSLRAGVVGKRGERLSPKDLE